MIPGWSNAFTSPYSLYYLRYVALNLGMGGLFIEQTPSAAFYGYVNPFLEKMQSLPVYMGGSVPPLYEAFTGLVNIDPIGYYTATKPEGAEFLIYPGSSSNTTETRSISSWLGSELVTIQVQEYLNLYQTTKAYVNPWPSCEIPISDFGKPATDGWQFATGIDHIESLYIYSPDLSRPLEFVEVGTLHWH